MSPSLKVYHLIHWKPTTIAKPKAVLISLEKVLIWGFSIFSFQVLQTWDLGLKQEESSYHYYITDLLVGTYWLIKDYWYILMSIEIYMEDLKYLPEKYSTLILLSNFDYITMISLRLRLTAKL